jgi:hypothetical protein
MFILRKALAELLSQYEFMPKLAHDNAVWLKENYEQVFPGKNDETTSDKIARLSGLVEVLLLHSLTYINSTEDEGKYAVFEETRKKIADYAKDNLPDLHLARIKAERYYAITKSRNKDHKAAVADYMAILEKFEIVNAATTFTDNTWIYEYLKTLASLGISYHRLASADKQNSEKYLLLALEIRKKYLNKAIEILGDSHVFLRSPYNDLGKTYLSLYDKDPRPDYLEQARYHLGKRAELVSEKFDPSDKQHTKTLENLSGLRMREGKLAEALTLAETALEQKRARRGSDFYNEILASYGTVTRLNRRLYQETGDVEKLAAAKYNADKAVEIAEHLFGGNETKYESQLKAQKEIAAMLP